MNPGLVALKDNTVELPPGKPVPFVGGMATEGSILVVVEYNTKSLVVDISGVVLDASCVVLENTVVVVVSELVREVVSEVI